MVQSINIVWYKRDLRVSDHLPLTNAAAKGAVLPLYVIEPCVIHAADYDRRHYDFTRACLEALRQHLADLGQPLIVRVGDVLSIFDDLQHTYAIQAIYAHEETGNATTFARDIAVRRWAKRQDIPFYETPNNGVIRPLRNRNQRTVLWNKQIAGDPVPRPPKLDPIEGIDIGAIPAWDSLNIHDEGIQFLQGGGELEARRVLHDFLRNRAYGYPWGMSSPVTAEEACSRISPHLAYGTLSLRQVFFALRRRQAQVAYDKTWERALRSFESRLHWHDHFIQKLEDEPRIEYESFIPQFDDLRDDPKQHAKAAQYFEAYQQGRTGYPMIDASIRYLQATGWINFRMRAMLVSFASYNLWIRWQDTAQYLARLFTDYEPGIHYSQVQMQSGTTGINTMRVYSPIKQAQDQDPKGDFIRRWIPELAHIPLEYIHEPHTMPPLTQREAQCIIGRDYPAPIVAHKIAVKEAKAKVWALRQQPDVKAAAKVVLEKHGSRKVRR